MCLNFNLVLDFYRLLMMGILFSEKINFSLFLLIGHLIPISLSAYINRKYYLYRKDKVAFIMVDLCLPIFGYFGIRAASSIIFLNEKWVFFKMETNRHDFGHEDNEVFLEVEMNKKKGRGKKKNKDYYLGPYIDVLNKEQTKVGLDALSKVANNLDLSNVHVVKKALNHPTYEIKYFSKLTLEKLETDMMEEINTIGETIKHFPNEYENYNERAMAFIQLVKYQIIDELTQQSFLKMALFDLMFSSQLNFYQPQIHVYIMEIYIKLRKYKEAIEWAKNVTKLKILSEDKSKILFYKAEAYFYNNQRKEVIKTCSEIEKLKKVDSRVKHLASWWVNKESCDEEQSA